MTTISQEISDPDKTKELQEENELLLQQLHYVQEELEKYYLRNKELESSSNDRKPSTSSKLIIHWHSEDAIKIAAENIRLKARADARLFITDALKRNALQARLGEMFIKASDNPASQLSALVNARRLWRSLSCKKTPAGLGGAKFGTLIEAHQKNGFDGVEKLMDEHKPSPIVRANAYRALSKHYRKSNPAVALEAARRAYVNDPKLHHQKWLAYMLYGAGKLTESGALLELTPKDKKMSAWDKKQRALILAEASKRRWKQANELLKLKQSQASAEKTIKSLSQQIDAEKAHASDLREKLSAASRRQEVLEAEKNHSNKRMAEHARALETRALELEQLRGDLSARVAELDSARSGAIALEQEKSVLEKKLSEHARALETRALELEQLRFDLSSRTAELEAQKKKLETQQQDIQTIKTSSQKLEQEKTALQTQLTNVTKLGEERSRLLESNDRDLKQLRGDLSARAAELEAQKKKLETGQQEIQAFKTAAQKLEQEKAAMQTQLTEAKKQADERGRAIEELKQKINSRLEAEKELEARQTLMNEEVLRAEAQIDLIRDMLLREPGI
jgi:chromosome segregation ATPase